MTLDPFWHSPVRMIQPNLRMIDAKGLRGEKLVRQCRDYGANAVLANAGGIVAWYPTVLPYHWRNPLLDHDYVGAVTASARRLGMRVLLRMDWSCLIPEIGRRHRDWLALDAAGRPLIEWPRSARPLMRTCTNRPYWQEFAFRELEELMSRYPVDGFFFNAWDLPGCRCPECSKAVKDALGEPLPKQIPWDSAFGRAYLVWRARHHADFTRRLNERITRFGTGALLTVDYHLTNDNPHHLGRAGWDGALLTDAVDMVTVEAFNFLDRSRPHWRYWAEEESRMISAFPGGKPGIVLLSGSERGYGRRPAQPPEQVELNIRQIVEHGGHPCVAFSGDFRQDDRKVLPVVKRVFRKLAAQPAPRRGWHRRTSRQAGVALVYGQRTLDLYGGEASRERALFHYRGWYEAFAGRRTDFTVVHDGALVEYLERHRELKSLVLPNCAVLGDAACRAIERWVSRGGRLVATHETSRLDEFGRRRRGFGLRCIRRRPTGRTILKGTWLKARGVAGRRWMGSHTRILPVSGEFVLTAGGRGGCLELLDWNFNNKPEWALPERSTGQCGIHENGFGRGRTFYVPFSPGKLYHLYGSGEHRELMVRLAGK